MYITPATEDDHDEDDAGVPLAASRVARTGQRR